MDNMTAAAKAREQELEKLRMNMKKLNSKGLEFKNKSDTLEKEVVDLKKQLESLTAQLAEAKV